jgi:hypothetical protein
MQGPESGASRQELREKVFGREDDDDGGSGGGDGSGRAGSTSQADRHRLKAANWNSNAHLIFSVSSTYIFSVIPDGREIIVVAPAPTVLKGPAVLLFGTEEPLGLGAVGDDAGTGVGSLKAD